MTGPPIPDAPLLPLPRGSQGEQLPFPGLPFRCGLNGCGKDAVCGLQNSSYPQLQVNVCGTCFKKMTGRRWGKGETLAVFARERDRLAGGEA